jgi:hypothetical protein
MNVLSIHKRFCISRDGHVKTFTKLVARVFDFLRTSGFLYVREVVWITIIRAVGESGI